MKVRCGAPKLLEPTIGTTGALALLASETAAMTFLSGPAAVRLTAHCSQIPKSPTTTAP
jgi:hypothetical protein